MYEYDFHSITFSGFLSRPTENYADIIRTRAAAGWRLSQMMMIPTTDGAPRSIELVFERPSSGPQDLSRADEPEDFKPEKLFQQPRQVRPPWTP